MNSSTLRLWNITKVGLKAISRNKMRSSLTMLGIVIGVACVIAMVAVGSGASKAIQANINALGSNFIMIFPGASMSGGARVYTGQSTLTADDANALKTECPAVRYVSAGVRTGGQVVAAELNWGTQIMGSDVEWPLIREWNLSQGEFFTEAEVKAGAKVAVLGHTVADNLFPNGEAVGQIVRIKNVPFRVIGVLEKKGGNQMGQDQDDTVVVPYTTAMKRLMGTPRIGIIYVSAAAPDRVQEAMEQIDSVLRQRQRIPPGGDANFMMRSQEEIASSASQMSKTLSTLLGSVAAISLLVGGIGIMNIMLVSVTERTREIGVRMAIGAKGRHVLLQFLFEAIALSIAGGLIGVLLGAGVSKLIAKFAGWPVDVSMGSVLLAFGFSAAIGIFFGFYPARKASLLDPIDALRYE
jgi:putative ABC transport system permease protein